MAQMNDTPIIGILSLEIYGAVKDKAPDASYRSYINNVYVQYLESVGAKFIPILIGRDREYYENIMKQINGVFFPGGQTYFNEPEGFAIAGNHIYDIAKRYNDNDEYFPLFGVSLGFQLLIYLSSNGTVERDDCDNCGTILRLDFKEDFRQSKWFRNAPEEIVSILETKAIFSFYNIYCYTEGMLSNQVFGDDWKVVANNQDKNEKEFISMIESKKYPFYGVTFHPARNEFQISTKTNPANNSEEAKAASRYLARFFVEECKKNTHTYVDGNVEPFVFQNDCYFFKP